MLKAEIKGQDNNTDVLNFKVVKYNMMIMAEILNDPERKLGLF